MQLRWMTISIRPLMRVGSDAFGYTGIYSEIPPRGGSVFIPRWGVGSPRWECANIVWEWRHSRFSSAGMCGFIAGYRDYTADQPRTADPPRKETSKQEEPKKCVSRVMESLNFMLPSEIPNLFTVAFPLTFKHILLRNFPNVRDGESLLHRGHVRIHRGYM